MKRKELERGLLYVLEALQPRVLLSADAGCELLAEDVPADATVEMTLMVTSEMSESDMASFMLATSDSDTSDVTTLEDAEYVDPIESLNGEEIPAEWTYRTLEFSAVDEEPVYKGEEGDVIEDFDPAVCYMTFGGEEIVPTEEGSELIDPAVCYMFPGAEEMFTFGDEEVIAIDDGGEYIDPAVCYMAPEDMEILTLDDGVDVVLSEVAGPVGDGSELIDPIPVEGELENPDVIFYTMGGEVPVVEETPTASDVVALPAQIAPLAKVAVKDEDGILGSSGDVL